MGASKAALILMKNSHFYRTLRYYVRTLYRQEYDLFQVHRLKGEYVAADGEAFEKELNRFLHYVSII